MIGNILKMLSVDDFMGKSELIDIAKGKNELTLNPKKLYKQKLRQWQTLRK